MRKINHFLLLFAIFYLLFAICSSAQAPQSFNYQLIARDTAGLVLSNKTLGIQISILKDASNGIVVYSERHTATSNNYGLVSLAIGTGAVVVGSFQPIDWGTHLHFVKIEIDPSGGTNYFNMGTTQLVSVPYALYAEKAGNVVDTSNTNELQALSISNDTLYLTNGGFIKLPPSLWSQNGNNIYNNNSGNVGIGTNAPAGKLIVQGDSSAPATDPLFEVIGRNGLPIMSVYEDSIHFWINETQAKANAQGGFAVSGRSSSKGATGDYLLITPDSTRIYLNESIDKANAQGGFAVSGRSSSKGSATDYLMVSQDSVRVYIDPSNDKGGFGVGSQSQSASDSLYLFSDRTGFNVTFLTSAERDAILNPRLSSIIFNTTDSCMQIYLGYWENIWCTPLGCVYPGVIVNPMNDSILIAGENISYTVLAVGSKRYYKWQESTDGGSTWKMLADGGTNPNISGVITSTLTLTNVPAQYDGNKYRCLIINACGDVLSNAASLNIWSCGDQVADIRDGQYYNTVLINDQCWMAENLNYGTRINGAVDQTNNSIPEKYCYNDNQTNCAVYGGLYQWAELVEYLNGATNTTSWNPVPTGNVQGICPAGWHIPGNSEWIVLLDYLGGENFASVKMREPGTTHWASPNTGATNSSGFTALAAGKCFYASFANILNYNYLWSATESASWSAMNREIWYDGNVVYSVNMNKLNAISVRCVKD